MVSRAIVASVLGIGMLTSGTFATSGDGASSHQSAIVRFERPTWVAGELLVGTYVIVHDDDKMARGEPCTALYRVRTGTHPLQGVVSFQCIPHDRKVVSDFRITVNSHPALGIDTFDTLTEFQFAGDSEGHGVPVGAPAFVSDRLRVPAAVVCAR